jgi:heptosyltransferase-1
MTASSKRILLIRLSAIGDIVMASPLIKALRRRYPQARIAWLAQPEVRELLEHNADLDEVIVWPRGEWRRLWRERRYSALWREIRAFTRRLRGWQADLAIDLQGLLKSGIWAGLSGAHERVGLGSREGSGHLMTRVLPRGGDPGRISSEYLFLAEQLGLPTETFAMDIALAPEDEAFARRFTAEHGLDGGYAVICPFTTRPQKHWFEERWVRLAPRLEHELGLKVLMLGGPGDRPAAERIAAMATGRLVDAVGRTRLRQAAALIGRARLLIGVDTGLTHMGIAFGTPTLALFGSTLPYSNTTRTDARVLYHRLPCSPCRRNPVCDGEFTCMRMIDEDEVVTAARGVLAARA